MDDPDDDQHQTGDADQDRAPEARRHGRTVDLGLPRQGLGELAEVR
jgi:hypothetical protein